MPSYNFTKRFAPLVESGAKRQTIRKTAKGATRGAVAHLFTGMRTKSCRRLGIGRITEVSPIEIGRLGNGEPFAVVDRPGKLSDGDFLVHGSLDALAKADGFNDAAQMLTWIEDQYGLPFRGYLHEWELQR